VRRVRRARARTRAAAAAAASKPHSFTHCITDVEAHAASTRRTAIVDGTGAFSWAFAVASMSAVLAMMAWGIVIPQVAPVPWPEVLTPAPATPAPAGAA